ncbi:hypothetical protein [Streptomyces sp. NPDC093261]|uniref:hypothetical protein n=1 Tax=Streptomyces sp. NPDC093261 TaxID=3366037 RepID=UPI0037FE172B
MGLYTVQNGAAIQANDINQVVNLLNGTTTNTPVTVSNRITAQLAGATAASGYVGGTAAGAPTSGTFNVGDYVIDQNGCFWICTTAGTPGTWNRAGLGGYTARVEQTVTSQNFSSGTHVIVPDTVDWDPRNMWSAATSQFTIPISGKWRITGRVSVSYATGGGIRTAVLATRNGTEFTRGFDALVGYFGGGTVADEFLFNANDTIQLAVYTEASCSTEIIAGRTFLELELVDV